MWPVKQRASVANPPYDDIDRILNYLSDTYDVLDEIRISLNRTVDQNDRMIEQNDRITQLLETRLRRAT